MRYAGSDSMHIKITHTTRYKYSENVFLDPHTIRLRPKSDGSQRLLSFDIGIDPEPDGMANIVDVAGNDSTCVWFSGKHDHLTITTRSEVETLRTNPFDYVVTEPSVLKIPVFYPKYYVPSLKPYIMRNSEPEGQVDRFVADVMGESGVDTLPFLAALNMRIYNTFEQLIRHEGLPYPAEITLGSGRGTCRDLTVLFMEACRAVGIAARFVSGYRENEMMDEERQLHAWAEVYIPGGGWRGYDPSAGLAVADQHITVSAGVIPEEAAPLTGSYRGSGARSIIDFEIEIVS
ncbi:MAG: transglutaminase N-terminal domain-containing protein [Thermodesulfobacteriota bacterium]